MQQNFPIVVEVASFNPDLLDSYQPSDLSDLDLTSVSSRCVAALMRNAHVIFMTH